MASSGPGPEKDPGAEIKEGSRADGDQTVPLPSLAAAPNENAKLESLRNALLSGDAEQLKPFMMQEKPVTGQESATAPPEARKLSKQDIVNGVREMRLEEALKALQKEGALVRHEFWDTQPVPRLDENVTTSGPVDVPKEVAQVRTRPLTLPKGFEWFEVDIWDDSLMEQVYILLRDNYVEDDDRLFRFEYSIPFLRWALSPPGYLKLWHVGVRVQSTGRIVGFITGIPATIMVRGEELKLAEINFLCVHKKLRSKRLAPVLIQEITRRVNLQGRWQAVYTAGTMLPKPVAIGRYYHRSLNPKKLVEVNFTRLGQRMTIRRAQKLFKLPETPPVAGLRKLESKDLPTVRELLMAELSKSKLYPVFDLDETAHWLTPREGVLDAYVIEDAKTNAVTDFFSFYHLPSTILGNAKHRELFVAYCFYCAAQTHSLQDLLSSALIIAQQSGSDVFNILDIWKNEPLLKDLKFGIGDGSLHYYLYNWRCSKLEPEDVGLILM